MRILHYFLGWDRGGGLNRYARDLAFAQVQAGDEVMVLHPAGGLGLTRYPTIVPDGNRSDIKSFALKGGQPVTLLEGVKFPEMVMNPQRCLDNMRCAEFVKATHPDVVHIHTWMGFPSELLPHFKEQGSRIVFTTHDYYGLCPRVNFVDETGTFCTECNNERCSKCNAWSPNERYLRIRNWELLIRCKAWLKPLLQIRKKHQSQIAKTSPSVQIQDYMSLQAYYLDLLRKCDIIHCNSQVSRKIYERYLPAANYVTLPITHGGIQWNPEIKPVNPQYVHLGFSGPSASFKGLPVLLDVLKTLPISNWHLDIWGTEEKKEDDKISWRGNYSSSKEAFKNLDLLVVPSVCAETFGFIVAEALALGVPVLCSDMVGAQLLVDNEMIYHGKEGLSRKLVEYLRNPQKLEAMRRKIVEGDSKIITMSQHIIEMRKLYCS